MNAKNLGGLALTVILLVAVAYALGFHPYAPAKARKAAQ